MARILIVTPAAKTCSSGNRVTAERYAGHFRALGHRVTLAEKVDSHAADLLVALHARKSGAALLDFVRRYPRRPTVLVLTGTDLYGDLMTSPTSRDAVAAAEQLVVYHDEALQNLPAKLRKKTEVIYKSCRPFAAAAVPLKRSFEISVSGHLRSVKDPLRAALATRRLPAESRIRITQFGAALSRPLLQRAEREMERNRRYRYLGEVPRRRARQLLARSRVLVVSSLIEGGANVIAEAVTDRVPVLASRILGNVGMLGPAYPGYFDLKNTEQLGALMLRCEQDARFYRTLRRAVATRLPLFGPSRERAALGQLVKKLLT